jgi:hypothetical protein
MKNIRRFKSSRCRPQSTGDCSDEWLHLQQRFVRFSRRVRTLYKRIQPNHPDEDSQTLEDHSNRQQRAQPPDLMRDMVDRLGIDVLMATGGSENGSRQSLDVIRIRAIQSPRK